MDGEGKMRGVMLVVGGGFDIVDLGMWLNERGAGLLQRTDGMNGDADGIDCSTRSSFV